MKRILSLFLLLASFVPAQESKPTLIVLISIDQMRADYFERYGKYFTGGFGRLYNQGIVYTNADLNYATSETGPGHATLGTGCFPWKSGIQGNEWIEVHTLNDTYCVSDSTAKPVDGIGGGFSPRNLMVTAIGDWLKKESPQSKVITVSSKDRAAILMGGKHPDYAFWYGRSVGGMVTSDYYTKSLPGWVKRFNASQWAEKNVPEQWTKSLPDAEYEKIGPDEFKAESRWNEDTSFPHSFTPEKKNEQIMGSPYGDKIIVDFAMEAVKNEKLGSRGITDLLCISLSNCDYVGHAMGPDSHEILDLLVKVDGYLEGLFSFLDTYVGKNKYVVALSADHAVCPLPEFNSTFRNVSAKRYNYKDDVKSKIDSLSISLKNELKADDEIIHKNAFINYSAGAQAGLDSIQLEQKVRSGLLSIEAYVDIFFRRELVTREPSSKPYIEKYRNSYFAPRGEDFQYRIRENCIISSRTYGSTHGSPYAYDTHIPVLFWWNGAPPQKISRPVFSADVAPTLAKFAGFSFPKNLDGVPLPEISK
ncbi:MAG: alkaline phosphatase family protein [Ignavibacteriales bacterium]|nr:alkaline phosphatase family protein [Ignavibacteriales bacterium]